MFETLVDTRQVLDRVRAARDTELAAAAEQLLLAAQWADLHPAARGGSVAGTGDRDLHGEGLRPLAGVGTPQVAEFAPAELAAHLGLTHDAGCVLIGDALELRHRLPRLWDLVHDQVLPAWRARHVAAFTRHLGLDMVTWVDRMLASDPQHLTAARAQRVVDEAVLRFEPDRAVADEQAALAGRHVQLFHDRCPATTDIHLRLDTIDALHFDQTINDLAASLRNLGDTDSLDVRRARSVGVLSDPQRALDLLAGQDSGPHRSSGVELVVHLDSHDLADPTRSGGTLEQLGPATRGLLAAWLGRPDLTDIHVRPVLDLHRTTAVDRHDPPDWMRQAAVMRDATCVFPSCTRDSRHTDLDHINAYNDLDTGGPPAQTTLANLAPLCRTHHRLKTHGAWSYLRLADNHYLWTTPTGDLLAVHTRPRRP